MRSFLNDTLALSHVPRWVIVRAAARQSVADHSYRTAMIVMELWTRLQPPDTSLSNVVMLALLHDVSESITGDTPSIVKDRTVVKADFVALPDWLEPNVAEFELVRLADRIEEYTWLVMNGTGYHAQEVADSLMTALREKYETTPAGALLPELIREITMEEGRLRVHADFPDSQR